MALSGDASTTLAAQLDALRARSIAQAPERAAHVQKLIDTLRASALMVQARRVGDEAVDFELPNAPGGTWRLSQTLSAGPVILCFYRGAWCPYCNLQLRAYQGILPAIEAAGATLIAVSPQTPDHSLSTAEKNKLAFPVLSDHANKVAAAYGLVFAVPEALQRLYSEIGIRLPDVNAVPEWSLPIPATYVIAPDRKIVLAHVDPEHRVRLEPMDALKAVQALKG